VVRKGGDFVVLGLVGEELEYSAWVGSARGPWRRSRGFLGQTFVAGPVGDAGTVVLVTRPPDELSRGGVLASADGLTWAPVVADDDLVLAAHGPAGFLALGGRVAYVSADGAAWTTAPIGTIDHDLVEIACADAGCVALGWRYEGPDQRSWVAFASTDGETWAPVPDLGGPGWGDPLRASTVGSRVAVLVGGEVYLSTDLRSWDKLSDAGLPADFWATGIVESGSGLLLVGSAPIAKGGNILSQAVSVLGSTAE